MWVLVKVHDILSDPFVIIAMTATLFISFYAIFLFAVTAGMLVGTGRAIHATMEGNPASG